MRRGSFCYLFQAINPTIIGNQILSGTSQVQTMPIVNATQDQQTTHDTTNSTIMITSPERNSQAECPLMSSTTNPPVGSDDGIKLLPKKEDVPVTTDEVTILPTEVAGIN